MLRIDAMGWASRRLLTAPWGITLFAAIGIAVSVSGCGVTRDQTDAAGAFSKSAIALADTVKTAYAEAPQDEADLRAARYVISGPPYAPPQSLGITELKGRLAAASVLSAYGHALSTLLDVKTQEADISAASGKLAGALKGLPKSFLAQTSITTAEIDSAGQLLTVFIGFYLDYRRREILEQIVPSMEPIVTKLCAKFGVDFDVDQPGWFANVYYIQADRILDHAVVGDFAQRVTVQPVLQRLDAIRTKTRITFSTVKAAATSCVVSSKALRSAVENRTASFDDILDFANKAEGAYSAIQAAAAAKR
jgi:hypothetical protein